MTKQARMRMIIAGILQITSSGGFCIRRNFGLRSPTKAAYSQQRWLAMPHAVEEFAPGPPSPQNGALLAAGSLGKDLGRVSMMA